MGNCVSSFSPTASIDSSYKGIKRLELELANQKSYLDNEHRRLRNYELQLAEQMMHLEHQKSTLDIDIKGMEVKIATWEVNKKHFEEGQVSTQQHVTGLIAELQSQMSQLEKLDADISGKIKSIEALSEVYIFLFVLSKVY